MGENRMFWSRNRKEESLATQLVAEFKLLRDSLQTSPAPPVGEVLQQAVDHDVLLRLESLEGRFEELRTQCIRNVQSGSQRLKMAEKKEAALAEAEELGDGPVNGVQMPLLPPEVEADADPLQEVRALIVARGETPLGG